MFQKCFLKGIQSQSEVGVSDVYTPIQNHQGQGIIFETEIMNNPKQSWSYSSDGSSVSVSETIYSN